MKHVIVAGSRVSTFPVRDIYDTLDHYLGDEEVTIISGGARGVDAIGEEWAVSRGKPYIVVKADWALHGRSAGYLRNIDMAEIADVLMAFQSNNSRGTGHMINIAKKRGLKVYEFEDR